MYPPFEPKLSLVGAGPGDPDLLTIKGAKVLATANVVLYDALANTEILEYAPKRAKKIFVGKRQGKHAFSQEKINKLIVSYAFRYGHVVRLKGGDPFVFGRGAEEIQAAKQMGIVTQIIPGITSAVAVPGNQGIALTQRGISQSFWVVTGTTSQKKISPDVALVAKSTATAVILMGMGKLKEIVRCFQNEGKGKIPAAIIQNGTLPTEKMGVGTVDTLIDIATQKQLKSPAIIVIGEVVGAQGNITRLCETMKHSYSKQVVL